MAQSIAGTNLGTNAGAASRTVCVELLIAWDDNTTKTWPADWALEATDETARLMSVNWTRQLDINPMGMGRGPVASMSLVLDNNDQRYSPHNTASAIAADIRDDDPTLGGTVVSFSTMYQTPVRLRMGFNDAVNGNEFITVFSGVIDSITDTYGVSGNTVRIRCLDRGALLIDEKVSKEIQEDKTAHDWIIELVQNTALITGGTIDDGLFVIPFLWMDDETLWSDCQMVAAADAGYFFFDELGLPQYRNATWWLTAANSKNSVRTINTARFEDLSPQEDWKGVSTGAIVEYSPRAWGGIMEVYRNRDTIIIPTAGTSFEARFNYPIDVPDPANNLVIPADFHPASGGGKPMYRGPDHADNLITWTISDATSQRCTVTLNNAGSEPGYLPQFTMEAKVLMGFPNKTVVQDASTALLAYNKREKLPFNEYVQTQAQAELIATLYAERLRWPRFIATAKKAPAIPWLQLGDLVTLTASDIITSSKEIIITQLNYSWAVQQPFLMDVTGIDNAALFEYTDAQYHIIGTDNYGSKVVFL